MMFAFTILCFSFFLSLVHASPLTNRDVFNPHITSPDANTEWPVGTQQTITWDTADIPPDSQLSRPDGKVLLGHLGPVGGLNLDFEHPLAQGFKLRDGKVQIKVPNVAPRDDYIIVLMGDSGNASPAFTIMRITGGGTSSSSKTPSTLSTHTSVSAPRTTTATGDPNNVVASPSTTGAPASAASTLSLPIPITGTVITGGVSDTSAAAGSSSAPGPGSSSAGSTSSAWSSHHFDSTKTFTIGIMSLALMLAM